MAEKSTGQKVKSEIDRLEKQFDDFNDQVKEMTLDRMNEAPKQETEEQTKLSQKEIAKAREIYLKPARTIQCMKPFNEKFRKDYNFRKEYVQFTAENREQIGVRIEIWTKFWPGVPAEFWEVPVNTPIWGPRYLAERLRECTYHRLVMGDEKIPASMGISGNNGLGQDYGRMVVDETRNRLDARPVSDKKSVFMGAVSF